MRKVITFLTLLLLMGAFSIAHSEESDRYVPETDPLALEKLDQWQDLKFGLLMHWALCRF